MRLNNDPTIRHELIYALLFGIFGIILTIFQYPGIELTTAKEADIFLNDALTHFC